MRQVFERLGADGADPTASTRGIVDPAAASGAFELVRLAPAPDLADLVERHWVIRWDLPAGQEFTQTVVPHPNANLVAEADRFAAYGIPSGLFARTLHGRGAVVGTKLRPGGLRALVDRPEAVAPGAVLPAAGFLGPGVADAGTRAVVAAGAGDDRAAVEAVTALLRPVADRCRTPRVEDALARIGAVLAALVSGRLGPSASVLDLATLAGTHPRSLQRLFARWVGVGPKWVLQRYRVHLAADLLAADPEQDLAELATAVGYYDQAHFSTDFQRATAATPAAYARRCAGSRNAVPARGGAPSARA